MKFPRFLERRAFALTDSRSLALFRVLYCTTLAVVFARDWPHVHGRHLALPFNGIPPFLDLHISHFPIGVIDSLFVVLLISLALAAIGVATRAMLIVATASVFLYLGQYLSLFKSPHSPYVFHSSNIIFFILFLLSCSPRIGEWSAGRLAREWIDGKTEPRQDTEAWPCFLILATIALLYFGSGYCKLVTSGPGWADGYTVQSSLLKRYLLQDHPPALNLAHSYPLCLALGIVSLLLECTFPIILFARRWIVWVYCLSAIAMHIGILHAMKINFLHHHALCFLILLDWPLVAWLRTRLNVFSKIPSNSLPAGPG